MDFLKLSVDLEAELAKITQRQHLNDVHYLVNLVRSALAAHPNSVEIVLEPNCLSLSHDGKALPDDHRNHLLTLLALPRQTAAARQHALTMLEDRYGIALLALYTTFPNCSLETEAFCLRGEHGVLTQQTGLPYRQGYRITIEGPRNTQSDEHRELTYFCEGAGVPILLNGKPINQPISLPDQLFSVAFSDDQGEGMMGVPQSGKSCVTYFYKGGLRLGTKQYLRADGLLFHGWWNHFNTDFEATYAHTISLAESRFNQHALRLYQMLGEHFADFDDLQKQRLKKVLFSQNRKLWRKYHQHLPLFDAVGRPWSINLRRLSELNQGFFGIPYAAPQTKKAPGHVPLLDSDDIAFLHREMGFSLRLIEANSRGKSNARPRGVDEIPSRLWGEGASQFLKRLNGWDPATRYGLTDGPCAGYRDGVDQAVILLSKGHPVVEKAFLSPSHSDLELMAFKLHILRMLEESRP